MNCSSTTLQLYIYRCPSGSKSSSLLDKFGYAGEKGWEVNEEEVIHITRLNTYPSTDSASMQLKGLRQRRISSLNSLSSHRSPVEEKLEKHISPFHSAPRGLSRLEENDGVNDQAHSEKNYRDSAACCSKHVLVVIASKLRQNIPVAKLMDCLMHYVAAIRLRSRDKLTVLSEYCERLLPEVKQVLRANVNYFQDVEFIQGNPLNEEHLRRCRITEAGIVVILACSMQPATPDMESGVLGTGVNASAYTNIGSRDNGARVAIGVRDSQLSVDSNTIIISLLVHSMLRDQYNWNISPRPAHIHKVIRSQSDRKRPEIIFRDKTQSLPFVLSDLICESNVIYLREKLYLTEKKIQNKYLRRMFAKDDFYDWPLLSSGSLFVHSAIDLLIIQSVIYPHLIPFWNVLITNEVSNGKSYNDQLDKRGCHKDNEKNAPAKEVKKTDNDFNVLKEAQVDESSNLAYKPEWDISSPQVHGTLPPYNSDIYSGHDGIPLLVFDKVNLPSGFAGLPFSVLFETLLIERGVLVVSLCRQSASMNLSPDMEYSASTRPSRGHTSYVHQESCSQSCRLFPVVEISPPSDTTVRGDDELFILR